MAETAKVGIIVIVSGSLVPVWNGLRIRTELHHAERHRSPWIAVARQRVLNRTRTYERIYITRKTASSDAP